MGIKSSIKKGGKYREISPQAVGFESHRARSKNEQAVSDGGNVDTMINLSNVEKVILAYRVGRV